MRLKPLAAQIIFDPDELEEALVVYEACRLRNMKTPGNLEDSSLFVTIDGKRTKVMVELVTTNWTGGYLQVLATYIVAKERRACVFERKYRRWTAQPHLLWGKEPLADICVDGYAYS